ncbi:MAG: dockerin type I repeat-containing protein [Clostridia bacterium]|nr:dockerin type I repeat-containing protein [Clostridia bacterium]
MKTMKKIVAILAVALMLCSALPMAVFAADTTIVFTMGADGTATHADGNKYTTYTETVGDYTLTLDSLNNVYGPARDAKGNGCIKLGASSKAGGFNFTVPADVTSVIIAVGKYKANTTKLNINGTAYTLSNASNDGAYDEIVIDTTSNKTITLTTVSGGYRAMVNSITYVIAAGNAGCDHEALACGETCSNCGEYTKEHKFSNNCTAECENGCGTANPNYADHVYGGIYDAECDVCFAKREVNMPAADSELTIAEAIALGVGVGNNCYTEGKYYVTGEITEVYNTTYGNLYITDGENTFTVYGLYDGNGTRYDAMTEKPEAGMTIKVYGIIGNYNGTAQMKNGDLIEATGGCEHEYEFECSTTCQLCGQGEREAECVTDAQYACVDGLCIYCGNDVNAVEHAFDDEWDADCNYGCGYTREVEEKPDMTEDTLDFSTLDQRTEYSTTVQVWQSNGLVLTNNKGGSTSNVGNYNNPARFYKGSEIIIAYPGMTKLVINAPTGQYGDPWAATLEAAGLTYTVESGVYTVTFAAPVDSITLTTTAQVRANSMTATAEKKGDDECAHNWIDATCTEPKTCSICGAVEGAALGHSYGETVVDATCTATGTKTYTCSACGDSYSEEIPMIPHNYVDGICSACGAELPLESTITFDADKTQRTEFGTESQKWEHDGLVLINNKGESSNNMGDYSAPVRLYKGSEIVISFPGMTSLVIDATGSDSDKLWDDTLTNAGLTFTVEEKIYTITFAEPTDSITLTAANQVRANSITATRVEECAHEYDNACDVDCNLCYETREVQHSVQHVEAKDATCAANGNIEYWYCDVCGMAWLDADCIQNTNLRAVVLPATGEHTYDDEYDADCNVCGDVREVPEKPVEIVYGDADGDGEITLLDATVLTQYLSGYEVTLTEDAADADGDGEITLLDATVLTQYLSGYDVTLGPVEDDSNNQFNDGELTIW